MHPVIRISIFLIFTFFIIQVKPVQLLLAGFILFSASLFLDKKYVTMMWTMVWRLKWFYISIFVLFSLFTPNDITITSTASAYILGNVNSGYYFSLIKITALILIVMSVIVLVVSIPRHELIASLILLSKPLTVIGFPSERFAVRLYLIIDFVETLPSVVSFGSQESPAKMNFKSKIKHIVSSLHLVVNEVYNLAENSECKKIQYDKINLPHIYQWGYLIVCIGLFYLSEIIVTQVVN